MDLDSSKNLGGVGAILLVVGTVGVIGSGFVGILALVGIILVLIAMNGLAGYYKEGGIFNNALYGFITIIVGGVAFVATLVVSVLMAIATLPFDWTNPAEWSTMLQDFMDFGALLGLIASIIVAFIVAFVFVIVSAIFYRKSFNLLATKSGVNMFGIAGLLLLIGAVLTIILVGFVLMWIAFILLAVGFFSIKTPTTEQPPTTPSSPS